MAEQKQQTELTPVEKRKQELAVQNQKFETVKVLLDKYKPSIVQALPKHLTADRIMRVFLTSVSKTPALLDCTQHSLMSSILTTSQLGLSVDPLLGEAYLIPFKNKKKQITECTVIIGYKGLIGLARRSSLVKSIGARAVFKAQSYIDDPANVTTVSQAYTHLIAKGYSPEHANTVAKSLKFPLGDYFKYKFGLEEELTHVPSGLSDPNVITHFYSTGHFTNGGHVFNVMTRSQVEAVRNGSQGYKSAKQWQQESVWDTNFEEMGNKTVLRRMMKFVPLSPELQQAVGYDEAGEYGSQPINAQLLDDPATDDDMREAVQAEVLNEELSAEEEAKANAEAQRREKEAAANENLNNSLNGK
jgi:recombination protein RecT